MKSQLLCFVIIMILCSALISSEKKNKKSKSPNVFNKNVDDFMAKNPPKDNSKLWNGSDLPGYSKVAYKGVHSAGLWTPPSGNEESDGGFIKIASPHAAPAPMSKERIIANDLPGKTFSASSFDLPARKNVLQINIPDSTTKTTTMSYNSFTTPPSKFENLAAVYHGISNSDKPVLHGRFKEVPKLPILPKIPKLEKLDISALTKTEDQVKKIEKKKEILIDGNFFNTDEIAKTTKEVLDQAKSTDDTAKNLAAQITPDPTNLVIPIVMKNKKENLSLDLSNEVNNVKIEKMLEEKIEKKIEKIKNIKS